jgi:uncharacterized membrane protein YgdD (TMEM256/DUF423 family)
MKSLRTLAALSAAIAIAAGAFGAHAAKPPAVEWFRTGAMYQLIHAVAAIALPDRLKGQSWMLLIGAAVFAGSLYAMALGTPRFLGAVTPVGGLAMIAGWLWIALRVR